MVASEPTSPVSQSAGPKPPAVAVARGNTVRETEKPSAMQDAQRIDATIAPTTLRRTSPAATTRADRRARAPTGSPIRAAYSGADRRGHEWLATGTSACSGSATGTRVAGAGVVIAIFLARLGAACPGAIGSQLRRVAR